MNVQSFEEACENRGYDPKNSLPDVSNVPAKHQAAVTATAKMFIIAEAINDGIDANWDDNDEEKWFPWFDMEVDSNNPSGFRFYFAIYDFTFTYATGGSRLSYRTKNNAEYAGKQFEDLYRDMMVIPK
jgi:hypothetical protein